MKLHEILYGETKYKHSNRKWRDRETETMRGKNLKSHGYLKNVDSIKRKKKSKTKLLQLRESNRQPPWIRPTADQLI